MLNACLTPNVAGCVPNPSEVLRCLPPYDQSCAYSLQSDSNPVFVPENWRPGVAPQRPGFPAHHAGQGADPQSGAASQVPDDPEKGAQAAPCLRH